MTVPYEGNLVEALQKLLAQEHAGAIRYATHSAMVSGPYAGAVAGRLLEIAADEIQHARRLRARITALGQAPTMRVKEDELHPADSLERILEVNVSEGRRAVESYTQLLGLIPRTNIILVETIEEILRDKQETLEELERLQPEGPRERGAT